MTTLYDQSGNGNDMWRGDTAANAPMDNGEAPKLCDLMAIDYWQLSDGTKIPVVVETGAMWKDKAQCLRNRDKTKNMPTGSKPQTTYAIFHAKYLNNNCCFNYGNTGKLIHYTGPGTLSALNFSKIEFWSKGTGSGPWVMVDWEQGVYAGNIAKCGSGVPASAECTTTGENPNPSVTFDVVTTLFKHDGTNHWAGKYGNAKAGALAVSFDLPTLPKGGYSPLKQEGGLGLGEGGAGDPNGTGGFSEGAVMASRDDRRNRQRHSDRASSASTASSSATRRHFCEKPSPVSVRRRNLGTRGLRDKERGEPDAKRRRHRQWRAAIGRRFGRFRRDAKQRRRWRRCGRDQWRRGRRQRRRGRGRRIGRRDGHRWRSERRSGRPSRQPDRRRWRGRPVERRGKHRWRGERRGFWPGRQSNRRHGSGGCRIGRPSRRGHDCCRRHRWRWRLAWDRGPAGHGWNRRGHGHLEPAEVPRGHGPACR